MTSYITRERADELREALRQKGLYLELDTEDVKGVYVLVESNVGDNIYFRQDWIDEIMEKFNEAIRRN